MKPAAAALVAGLALAAGLPEAAPGQALADAAERGDRPEVERLIAAGGDPAEAQADGTTALHWAACRDDLEIARALVAAGADVAVENNFGVTPLTLAAHNGAAELAGVLLAAGAHPDTRGPGGATALMLAARNGRASCVELLIAAGADVDSRGARGQTALMWAAAEGHAAVVRALVAAGADIRRALPSGFTPLLFAVRGGHSAAVAALLDAGADVTAAAAPQRRGGRRMRAGTSPLILAVENGHFELAAQLLDAGADPGDARTGFTPLHTLVWVRKSVRGDGDDGIPPPRGSGALGSLAFARLLVERGADVNAQLASGGGGRARVHRKGATPFLMAAETGDLDYLKTLIDLGADPSIPNVEGTTPILAAAGLGVTAPGEEAARIGEALATVEFLLGLGADIDAVDDNGETVMHAAAYKCEPQMVELLDQRGADIAVWNRENKWGWTPLRIARGYRPGNFRPINEMIASVSGVMRKHGTPIPPPPTRPQSPSPDDWDQPSRDSP